MPGAASIMPAFHPLPAVLRDDGGPKILKAAAGRSIFQEDPDAPMLPPAGASRADTVFMTVGAILLLILAGSLLWTLLRQRRR
ncbi:hypothetical protein [Microvirga lotononidis]|uniref:Uncharacterized protein n=1 Tax=Microvirga lotononidis TaxID=864069 RepID=I4Z302_9HYPH|nr:hypothetical protein [Microvirga lotononidis]EIM30594.1 hypothetical protein MicloDRAFT_00008440 [Microvirga lotononidis]WQO26422.1 hypothetical protein U0023_17245 [Microvirga lotononidis]